MPADDRAAGSGQRSASRRGRRADLAVGILLGLALGIAVVYLLVVAIGGGRDSSQISTPSQAPPGGTRTEPGANAPEQP